jgi:hypothetical protein
VIQWESQFEENFLNNKKFQKDLLSELAREWSVTNLQIEGLMNASPNWTNTVIKFGFNGTFLWYLDDMEDKQQFL